ncbi:hypothetical protein B0H14DRAFT_3442551 [Mycena olivaceomarginata]|nr:hypothetical protein B0H14DRAFT_3442551 [Mycena olivaceomarginata]
MAGETQQLSRGVLVASIFPGCCGDMQCMATPCALAIARDTAKRPMMMSKMRSAVDVFEKVSEDGEGGEREGRQNDGRDGEKEGQEKDDPHEKENEDGEDEEEGEALPTHAELLQRKYPASPKPTSTSSTRRSRRRCTRSGRPTTKNDSSAHDRMLQGEKVSTAEELADTPSPSRKALLTGLCAQMQCKGVLILGEIVEGDEDVFISMVHCGGLPQHPDIDFGSWAPVRSKAFVQAFADFLVAYKKAEKGLLTALRDQAPRSDRRDRLCLQDVAGRQEGKSWLQGVAGAADQTPTGGWERLVKGTDTEEEEEEIRWDGSDAERDDDPLTDEEEDVDQLQSSTDDERRELPFSAKASLKYQHIVAVGQGGRHWAAKEEAASQGRLEHQRRCPAATPSNAEARLPSRYRRRPACRGYGHGSGRQPLLTKGPPPAKHPPPTTTPAPDKTPPANKDATPDNAPPSNCAPFQRAPFQHALPHAPANQDAAAARAPPPDSAPPANRAPPDHVSPADKDAACRRHCRPWTWTTQAVDEDAANTPPALRSSSLSALCAACPVKYQAVLELFDTVVEGGIWKSAALSAKGRPGAVSRWVQRGRSTVQIPAGLGSEDEREDFYDAVILWWYCIAEIAEGSVGWRKLVDDVVWVLTEKHRALAHKRGACDISDSRTAKRTRVE